MRFLRRALFLIFLLALLPLLAIELFGDPIARRVVAALNERVQTRITVQEYDLSLLRAFPQLAVDLQGVQVEGSDGSALLEADHLACVLDLSSLLGTVRVTSIRLSDGKLQLFTDRDGNTNYQITHTSIGDQAAAGKAEGGAAGALFSLEAAQLDRITLVYQDARLQTDALLTIDEGILSGDFGSSQYTLEVDGTVGVGYFDQDGTRYLDGKALGLSGQLTVDHVTNSYRLTPLRIASRALEVEATGVLTLTDAGVTTNLRLSSTAGELEDVLSLLPPTYAATLGGLETDGRLSLQADITGAWTDRTYPRLTGTLDFRDGKLSSPRMNATAREVDLQATFDYVEGPGGGVQTIAVERLTGSFRGAPFDLRFRLEDLYDPVIAFSANGSLPLDVLPAFLPTATVTGADGLLHFTDLSLTGRYADMIEPRRAARLGSGGTLRADDIVFTLNEQTISLPSGTLELNDNEVAVTALQVVLDGTDVLLDGRGSNLIPVLFADSLNSRDAALRFEATLEGKSLDVAELLAVAGFGDSEITVDRTPTSTPEPTAQIRAQLTDLLHGTFEARVADWQWDAYRGATFRGQFVFLPGRLDVRGLTTAMGGEIGLDAITYFDQTIAVDARLTARGVDAREFFRQSADFGQEVLTSDHLTGTMNAKLLLDLHYDDAGELEYEDLGVLASIEILDGELRDFDLLENFAFALKSGDLERVRFTRLANVFEIRDRTVYIPAMFIQSSAINLTLSGTHTLDQYLDYYVKVNAGQVVTNKLSRHDNSLEVLPARNGLFNVYYTIRGPLESYGVESDKQSVKTNFRRSDYRRDRIRKALADRFRTPIALFDLQGEQDDVAD
ncbi:hypothetical protein LEM8419_02500 [Neolewinella maritima]|uniref:AsmA-like C-terminal domain-containing protein n=1 Tax=Neolewinella maritima TaxID=1383882 RepID=A0ABM9B3A1_9BACT|nr:AsmA-like C-terminal region-containing protein [Neolewinella maritima]CAH1001595.1 hypothetical protein LEM8419_02500 [Neolewinella maritima]